VHLLYKVSKVAEIPGPLRFLAGVLASCQEVWLRVVAFVSSGHFRGPFSLMAVTGPVSTALTARTRTAMPWRCTCTVGTQHSTEVHASLHLVAGAIHGLAPVTFTRVDGIIAMSQCGTANTTSLGLTTTTVLST
jgi:hypothetical protein